MRTSAGRFTATTTLKVLIQTAWHVQGFQIKGEPGWADTQLYDIDARSAAELTPPQLQLMTQALLADRFKLATHHESGEVPSYVLSVEKGGSKLQASGDQDKGVPPGLRAGRGQAPGTTQMSATKVPLEQFTAALSAMLGMPVADRTGLQGNFDFRLEWTMTPGPPNPASESSPAPDLSGPSIFTAIQEQLGLKLDAGKTQGDVLIVDHAERPSEN